MHTHTIVSMRRVGDAQPVIPEHVYQHSCYQRVCALFIVFSILARSVDAALYDALVGAHVHGGEDRGVGPSESRSQLLFRPRSELFFRAASRSAKSVSEPPSITGQIRRPPSRVASLSALCCRTRAGDVQPQWRCLFFCSSAGPNPSCLHPPLRQYAGLNQR